jgi:hypothetical protein
MPDWRMCKACYDALSWIYNEGLIMVRTKLNVAAVCNRSTAPINAGNQRTEVL